MLRQIINFILNKDGGTEGKAYEAGYLAGKHDGYEEGRQAGFQAGLRRGKVSLVGDRIVLDPHSARVDYAPGFDSTRGSSDERVL